MRKISVCIPCFNASEFLLKTLESVYRSSYKNFEVHVIDNASTDGTVKIVEIFKKKHANLYLHKNKRNIGMFANMNKCIDICTTKYLKIVCADDLLSIHGLKHSIGIMERNSDVVLVYGASGVINEKGSVILTRRFFRKDKKLNGGVLINKILQTGRNPIGEPTGILLRTSVLKRKKLRFNTDFRYVSDLELWIKMLHSGNGYYCNEILSNFRIHKNQGTNRLFRRAIDEHIMLFSKYSEEFGLRLIDYFSLYIKLVFYFLLKMIFLYKI